MARRAQPVKLWPGIAATCVVAGLILGPLALVALQGSGPLSLSKSDIAAIRFTAVQAALSAALSLLLAIPVARALARRQFAGRTLLITLLGAPFLLPVIVAVLGLIAIFGRAGIVNEGLAVLGLPPVPIYGFHGVVLAHVFFNMPLATRMLLQGWSSIPAERFRLAAQLGFNARDINRHLERPMLARRAPAVFAVIFAICASSFAVALTLGGGPKATTVELAIYQAFRFDFDMAKATQLAVIQLCIAACAGALALWLSQGTDGFGQGIGRSPKRWDGASGLLRLQDAAVLCAASLFLLAPMLAIGARGVWAIPTLPAEVWRAAGFSLQIAALSTGLCMGLALAISVATVHMRALENIGILAIASSPLVIGTGLFIAIFPIAPPQDFALIVTASLNAVMALPFVLRALIPAVQDTIQTYGQLAQSLNLTGLRGMRIVVLPAIRGPFAFAAGLCAALSMGDLGVIALFSSTEVQTLPLQVYTLMGAYRMDEATGAAVLLAGLSFLLFWITDWIGRRNA